jgi:hypothetical protein
LNLVSGSVRNNQGAYLSGGIEQEHGDFTMSGGEVLSNSTPFTAGGIDVYGVGAVFTQTGGAISGNYAAGWAVRSGTIPPPRAGALRFFRTQAGRAP